MAKAKNTKGATKPKPRADSSSLPLHIPIMTPGASGFGISVGGVPESGQQDTWLRMLASLPPAPAIFDRPHLGERRDRAVWMLTSVLLALVEIDGVDPAGRKRGGDFVDRSWLALHYGPRGKRRNAGIVAAIVTTLENSLHVRRVHSNIDVDPLGRMIVEIPTGPQDPRPDEQERARRYEAMIAFAMRSLAGFDHVDREALARAIEAWPRKGSHARWPALYELARSMGWSGTQAALKTLVNRALTGPTRRDRDT